MKRFTLGSWSTALIVFGLTALGFALWVGVQASVWLLLRLFGIRTDLWAMIEALSTAVTVAALVSGAYIAYRELDELSNTRYIEISNQLFQELNAPANIEARRWVIRYLPEDPVEGTQSLDDEGRSAVKHVLNSLDHIAFLTQAGWIPDDLIMPWMNPMVVKVWAKLEPYVAHEARRRREPDYYAHARDLAERCIAWRTDNLPDAELTWVEDAL